MSPRRQHMQRKQQQNLALNLVAALVAGALPGVGLAALIDLSPTPLSSSSSNLVKPNVNFVLDASGSMNWSHAPDESQPLIQQVGYKSAQCNSIYYQPTIIYPPARKADGTSYANSNFTSAWTDGIAGTGNVNLGTSFYAYDNTTGADTGLNAPAGGPDPSQPAYYYVYYGDQSASGTNFQNTNSQFYDECNAPEASG